MRQARRSPGSTVASGDPSPLSTVNVGLGIDRIAPLDQLGQHRARVARLQQRPVAAARRPAATARRDRRAATPRRRARAITARVAGSMKAPPPVASTCTGCAQQPGDDPPLAVAKHRLAAIGERSPRWSRRPPPRSRRPNRRTADRAAPRGGGRSWSCRRPSARPARSCGSARKPRVAAASLASGSVWNPSARLCPRRRSSAAAPRGY